MTRSLLLGLDVSPRRIGFGLVDLVTGEPVACGCEHLWITSTRKAEHEAVDWRRQAERTLDALRNVSVAAIRGGGQMNEIQAVFIEEPAIPRPSGVKSAYNAGLAVGIAMAEVQRRWSWVTVQFLNPKEWRMGAGLKGNASKEDCYLRAIDLGFGEEVMEDGSRVLSWVVPGGQDGADAACIAVAGQRRNGESWEAGQAA